MRLACELSLSLSLSLTRQQPSSPANTVLDSETTSGRSTTSSRPDYLAMELDPVEIETDRQQHMERMCAERAAAEVPGLSAIRDFQFWDRAVLLVGLYLALSSEPQDLGLKHLLSVGLCFHPFRMSQTASGALPALPSHLPSTVAVVSTSFLLSPFATTVQDLLALFPGPKEALLGIRASQRQVARPSKTCTGNSKSCTSCYSIGGDVRCEPKKCSPLSRNCTGVVCF